MAKYYFSDYLQIVLANIAAYKLLKYKFTVLNLLIIYFVSFNSRHRFYGIWLENLR
jgi:hypothetical protein